MSTKAAPPKPRFFATAAAFRTWLAKHQASAKELVLGFWRVSSGRRGITYAEALDEALCFGWIDGVRRGLDDERWTVRFTPRKRGSLWSRVNVRHVARLEKEGRMQASGRAAFAATDSANAYSYAEDARRHALGPDFQRRLAADAKAHAFWEKAAPWYKRAATKWIVTAKQDATRERRFAQLLDCSRRGGKVPPLDYPTKVPAKKRTAKKSAAAPKHTRTTRRA